MLLRPALRPDTHNLKLAISLTFDGITLCLFAFVRQGALNRLLPLHARGGRRFKLSPAPSGEDAKHPGGQAARLLIRGAEKPGGTGGTDIVIAALNLGD